MYKKKSYSETGRKAFCWLTRGKKEMKKCVHHFNSVRLSIKPAVLARLQVSVVLQGVI